MSFNFGTPITSAATPGGFSFGIGSGDSKAPTPQKPLEFNLSNPQTGGFNITPKTTAAAPTAGFGATPSFLGGQPVASSAATTSTFANPPASFNLLFGSGQKTSAPSLGILAAPKNATAPTMGLGVANTASPSLLGTPASTAPALGGFSLAAKTTAPTSTLSLGGAALAATTSAPSIGLLGATPASGTGGTGFTLGATPASTAAASVAPSFNFGTSSATSLSATTATGFSLATSASKPSTTSTSLGFSLTTSSAASSVPATSAVTSALPATGTLTYAQLEDAINKWTIDLEEQSKLFGNQAKQLNAWDRLLVSNGEKILSLNSGIEKVKQQQQQLDQELDFVVAQQKELEDLIKPLEKELSEVPVTDQDRQQTYQLAENIDTQLKQMSEELKEIIEQLNESNKSLENSNPITQIGKILNAHMNSLQWIDTNTSKITTHLDQVSKLNELRRKNHENNMKKLND